MLVFYILLFIVSSFLLAFSGTMVVGSLISIARHLKWREFVVGFFIMAIATSAPNLFVGINAALRGIPQLSFGDVVGGNVVDLTLAIALAALVGNGISAESKMVQTSALFTLLIAVLPILLSLDGKLGQIDGLVLILAFLIYAVWLFATEDRFHKVYKKEEKKSKLWKSASLLVLSIILLIIGSQGVVNSSFFFAKTLGIPIGMIGILIVGLGNALPEIYFGIVSAKKGESWLVLGDLMGSVINSATLVLGIVVLICPITITDFSPYLVARIFMVISAIFFLIFIRSGKKITKKEAFFLLGIYIAFLISEVFLRRLVA
ncbi:sodium:calcium antiporter [Candidatus Parcubacteria bacterium]|nr:sodium:calcium antiporter [Patescibacteria group bacterium]MBU4466536.1 sodium:calcium antiporter [Patescibacteria group bacterium]MCG2688820.1 sodium:calcium antiporter [Candidatus Parcubacteria bacterium]